MRTETIMFINIEDTQAKASTNHLGRLQIQISRLSGSEGDRQIRMYTYEDVNDYADISFNLEEKNTVIILFVPYSKVLLVNKVEFTMDNGETYKYEINTLSKIADRYMITCVIEHLTLLEFINTNLSEIKVSNKNGVYFSRYYFRQAGTTSYQSEEQGKRLLKFVCKTLVEEAARYGIVISNEFGVQSEPLRLPPVRHSILEKQYNLNTKYCRKMARRQAAYNYQNGSQEYRNSIDNIGCIVWSVIIAICIIVFIIIWNVSGPEAAIKWLR